MTAFMDHMITISAYTPRFIDGIGITLYMTVVCVVGGFVLAVPIALMKISRVRLLRTIGYVYTDIFRSVPALVILYISYFAIPSMFKVSVSATTAAFITLSMVSAAYVSEALRGGVEAIDVGQKEAAKALGIPYSRTMMSIVLPQALRSILPSLVNEMVGNLKSTSLISIIGVADLMRVSRQVMADTFITFEPLLIAAVIYYVLTKILSVFAKKLETRINRGARKAL
ncbi:amino acid ABC transporter permease [Bacilliculturomica massiliensis]|uniref:amino acid ABC transporter permease n=1 Tax=Bacilliculturomica massiliensis TaxID=1917867 RepID=UPI001031B063|nr:amino acid ABC transporter permease [Bacilliculturomica massiliensis]